MAGWVGVELIEKLCTKFKPGDMIASAEQLEKLMKLTLKKNQEIRSISKARLRLSKLVMGAKLRKS